MRVDAETIRKAEVRIESCEQCHPADAEFPFDWALAEVTGGWLLSGDVGVDARFGLINPGQTRADIVAGIDGSARNSRGRLPSLIRTGMRSKTTPGRGLESDAASAPPRRSK